MMMAAATAAAGGCQKLSQMRLWIIIKAHAADAGTNLNKESSQRASQ
jgi:hypothetical protein